MIKQRTILPVWVIVFTVLILFTSCNNQVQKEENFAAYVDPFIGSGGHGHVFVGANVPFGMVQLGPTNPTVGWDWCSGYHYSDSVLMGFTHTHLSGTGIGDLCDILVMPVSGDYNPDKEAPFYQNWTTHYSHDQEEAEPGYYKVFLNEIDVNAELTTTERVGFHKYDFKKEGNSSIIVDLISGTGWDSFTDGTIIQVGDKSVEGYRFSTGWSVDQRLFYRMEFSKSIRSINYIKNNYLSEKQKNTNITAVIEFEGNGELMVKTALSPTSAADAVKNMESELNHWDFDLVRNEANKLWSDELSKIKVTTDDSKVKRTFYTALYHTMISPSLYNNSDGTYLGTDKMKHDNPGFNNYSVFSLWDTYRAAHPLFSIVQPQRVDDMVNSMLAIYEQQGKLPVWHLMGSETNTMIGYHAVPVIVDAFFKGFRDYDVDLAYKAVKASAMRDDAGLFYLKSVGYIPADKEKESVAKAMEYAVDDWCIAQMAKELGYEEDYQYFMKRAKAYSQYYDQITGFMRGKLSNGEWREPFSPFHSSHRDDDYCEGNAWQYLWLVPQDVEGLISVMGGENLFINRLDSLFNIDSSLQGAASPDISGLLGQYAHGNEPSHHITYLYAFAGEQWKTAQKVREIMDRLYHDQPDGLSGNEDCGQMSAWYVLSAMGIYPVNPAAGIFVFGSPAVQTAQITLPENKLFSIKAEGNTSENIYIQSVTLNGKPYTKSFITYSEIIKGGELVFYMGNKPNLLYGSNVNDRPCSKVYK